VESLLVGAVCIFRYIHTYIPTVFSMVFFSFFFVILCLPSGLVNVRTYVRLDSCCAVVVAPSYTARRAICAVCCRSDNC